MRCSTSRRKAGSDLASNPALWWLINYKDSRWADAGIDAELKRRGLFDPDTVTINEVTVPAPRASPRCLGRRHREAARQREARRDRGGACLMCHRVDGHGVDYGPALDGFASRQTTRGRDHGHRESFERYRARI